MFSDHLNYPEFSWVGTARVIQKGHPQKCPISTSAPLLTLVCIRHYPPLPFCWHLHSRTNCAKWSSIWYCHVDQRNSYIIILTTKRSVFAGIKSQNYNCRWEKSDLIEIWLPVTPNRRPGTAARESLGCYQQSPLMMIQLTEVGSLDCNKTTMWIYMYQM